MNTCPITLVSKMHFSIYLLMCDCFCFSASGASVVAIDNKIEQAMVRPCLCTVHYGLIYVSIYFTFCVCARVCVQSSICI